MKITDKYIFFWKEAYSQWYMSNFTDPFTNITFNCAEQYMMWCKAMLFKDNETANKILQAKHPSMQKKLGRLVKGYDEKAWNQYKFEIVMNGNVLKFMQDPKLVHMLLSTEQKSFVEASPLDPIWGIMMSEEEEGIEDPTKWKGENLLGYALDAARYNIRRALVNTNYFLK